MALLPLDRERVVSVTVRRPPSGIGTSGPRSATTICRDCSAGALSERHTLYDEAMRELEGILSRDPDNEEARRLAKVVEQLIVLQEPEQRRRAGEGEGLIEAPEAAA